MLNVVVICKLFAFKMFLWTKRMKANAHAIFFVFLGYCAGMRKDAPAARNMCTLFGNSSDHALCCMQNHENILLPLRCCQLSLSDQPETILSSVAQLILSQSKLDGRFVL
ncbi:hypothetical protein TNIN_320351 [Trichonephila inaurata madagascariensis]|uniref:Uncharacterized protein n=1 Tax=Trichonephila inaurata madagascariensis TaxID=2747483 RepID=A0A8X6YBF7_9ARAC|nr:hypothetical protein TNIN_320351 [Trichonephila inaurata madagascariensis]